jgi:argininosuccinate synthase
VTSPPIWPGRGAVAGAQEGRDAGHQAQNIFIDDVREEFVQDFVFPMFRANALYEASTCSAPRSPGR